MEIFWLAVAILTAVVAGMMIKNNGFAQTDKMFLVFPLIAAGLYAFRRRLRRNQSDD